MEIQVNARNFSLPGGSRDELESRIRMALAPHDAEVANVVVQLCDAQHLTRGVERTCVVFARLRRAASVVAECADPDADRALIRALRMAGARIDARLGPGRTGIRTVPAA